MSSPTTSEYVTVTKFVGKSFGQVITPEFDTQDELVSFVKSGGVPEGTKVFLGRVPVQVLVEREMTEYEVMVAEGRRIEGEKRRMARVSN